MRRTSFRAPAARAAGSADPQGARRATGPLFVAPAIVLYFVLPIGFSAIGAIAWFKGIVPRLDWWGSVWILAESPLDAAEWARAGTRVAVWIVLPLLAGVARVLRQEVS
jgi:ABC-2 type transport system permease protein